MSRKPGYYSDGRPMFYDRQGKPMSLDDFASAKYESEEYRRIGLDTYPSLEDQIDPEHPLDPGDPVTTVSTVWLGLDQGHGFWHEPGETYRPVIFETMIFSGDDMVNNQTVRYCTESQAREGHWRTVQDIRTGQVPWFLRNETADAEEDQ